MSGAAELAGTALCLLIGCQAVPVDRLRTEDGGLLREVLRGARGGSRDTDALVEVVVTRMPVFQGGNRPSCLYSSLARRAGTARTGTAPCQSMGCRLMGYQAVQAMGYEAVLSANCEAQRP